jgi:hypothetical protein
MTFSALYISVTVGITVFVGLVAAFVTRGRKKSAEAASPQKSWKLVGLWVSFVLQVLFWVSYLSLMLEKIGSPLADIIWLAGGVCGIVFGIINLLSQPRRYIKVLSCGTLSMGIILLPLWMLAVLVTAMREGELCKPIKLM